MWVKRSGIILIFVWVSLVALLFRIYYVSYGDINSKVIAAAGKRNVTNTLYNSKGIIYDRNFIPLAGNQFMYYLVVDPRQFDKTMLEKLCEVTDSDENEISAKLTKETPFILTSYTLPEEMDGVYIREGVGRYSENRVAEHIIGYLDSENIVGISGIEKAYDDILSQCLETTTYSYNANAVSGINLSSDVYVDNTDAPLNGVVLTLDKNLTEFSEICLKNHLDKGCVIVMDCDSGELLTVSSLPEYDVANISDYSESENGELINNALVNQTVGSVFKLVLATAAIENGLGAFEFECKGSTAVNEKTFTCQNEKDHGRQGLKTAFANSCNCYFISLGQLLGYDCILETAQIMGLDSSLRLAKNIYSVSGKLPDDNGAIALANLSIGQGELLLSPLTVARMTAMACNGGYLVNPTVYKGLFVDGDISCEREYQYKSRIISDQTASLLKEMCIECVENGTGRSGKPENDLAGAKTASAQTGVYNESGNEKLNTYFTGFYPATDPKYVITVFALDGRSGSATCGPVFKEICDFISQNY